MLTLKVTRPRRPRNQDLQDQLRTILGSLDVFWVRFHVILCPPNSPDNWKGVKILGLVQAVKARS